MGRREGRPASAISVAGVDDSSYQNWTSTSKFILVSEADQGKNLTRLGMGIWFLASWFRQIAFQGAVVSTPQPTPSE
jgi:hypothetical protein